MDGLAEDLSSMPGGERQVSNGSRLSPIGEDQHVFEISDDVVSGHALAARWKVRSYLLREIAREILPEGRTKSAKERYYLGPDEQRALREVLLVIGRQRTAFRSGSAGK